jgi:hypothetical protein
MKTIMFKDDMYQAVLDLRKTQTRRLDGLHEINKNPDEWKLLGYNEGLLGFEFENQKTFKIIGVKPKYTIYDIVGIKENFEILDYRLNNPSPKHAIILKYLFDNEQTGHSLNKIESEKFIKWKKKIGVKSKLFMFDSLIRNKIQITDIRVERCADISIEDCLKEGVYGGWAYPNKKNIKKEKCVLIDPILDFRLLWDSINKKRGYGWDKNPYEFRYEFKLLAG